MKGLRGGAFGARTRFPWGAPCTRIPNLPTRTSISPPPPPTSVGGGRESGLVGSVMSPQCHLAQQVSSSEEMFTRTIFDETIVIFVRVLGRLLMRTDRGG